jgi:hypothetical protein
MVPRTTLTIAIAVLGIGFQVLAEDDVRYFEQQVAPLITARCSSCHNASDRKGGLDITTREQLLVGGDSGSVLAPGALSDSLLWQRVVDGEMPPTGPLAAEEQAVLRLWIERGAKWGGGALDPFRYTTDTRAGYDWWSLQELGNSTLKNSSSDQDARFLSNPIDHFVAAKLRAAGLVPAEEADRRTLIRRLSFDLTGLPPDPADIDSFVAEPSPAAYEQLVDRLLADPAYGERWARHWLDVARFGESQGFERDKLRTNSWRYRDWVIEAFNGDMPYDQFAKLQLAGDILQPQDPQGLIATGFLVAGPYDEVGQKQQSAAMRAVVREDELEDLISTISQTFLGLTVNCSRCHDHKFDPVHQFEYYQLAAALAGVHHGEPELPDSSLELRDTLASRAITGRMRVLEEQLEKLESPFRERLLAERRARAEKFDPPRPLSEWDFAEDFRDRVGELHGQPQAGATLRDGKLVLDGKGFVLTAPLTKDLREKTLEAWVSLADLDQQGGGVVSIQTPDGHTFDAIVYGERERRQWMAGSNSFERTESFEGAAESAAADGMVHVAIAYHSDGTVVGYRDGQRYGSAYKSQGPVTFSAGAAQIAIGLRHAPAGGNRVLRGEIDRVRIYDRALSDEEVAASAGATVAGIAESDLVALLPADLRDRRALWRFEREQLTEHVSRLNSRKVYAVEPQAPAETFVLIRGNPGQKGDRVSPGGIAAVLGETADFALPDDCADTDRRRALAEWICGDRNPLFARVIVNRLWHYHFGVGLVETPNDFGFNGGRPSHPQLLDWLARELIRSDWSLKHVQRIIVQSAAYRRSSRILEPGLKVDAANRLLWRKSPQRLEAEALRDTLLQLAGELQGTLYGPGFYDFETHIRNSQFYELRDPAGPTFQRKSIYRTWVRSGRSPFLDVFDCPDPSTKTPQRAVTTTPLQALSLLNNSFVLRVADQFADRVAREAGPEVGDQVHRAFDLALGRPPDAAEHQLCSALVREHGLHELCRVLCNSSELLYVD